MSKRFPSIFSFSKLAVVAVAAMVVFSHPGVAEEDVQSVQKILQSIDKGEGIDSGFDLKYVVTNYVAGVGAGIARANGMVKIKDGVGLYCPPDKLVMIADQYVAMLRKFVATIPGMEQHDMGTILLIALMETFPCE